MSTGAHYEALAAHWLKARGCRLIARNVRYRSGEIDLIVRHCEHLVFVEVRQRSNARFAGAAASVSYSKQQRLLRAASCFLQEHAQWAKYPCRFDVIAFEPPQSGANPAPRWIQGAFTA
ncbi:MAG: YraN family protein [Parahaliea sp.]